MFFLPMPPVIILTLFVIIPIGASNSDINQYCASYAGCEIVERIVQASASTNWPILVTIERDGI